MIRHPSSGRCCAGSKAALRHQQAVSTTWPIDRCSAPRTGDGHQAGQGAVAGDDQVPHNHAQGEVLVTHGDEQGGKGARGGGCRAEGQQTGVGRHSREHHRATKEASVMQASFRKAAR